MPVILEGIPAERYLADNKRLQEIEANVSGGTGALLALILNNRLYVVNVGKSPVVSLIP